MTTTNVNVLCPECMKEYPIAFDTDNRLHRDLIEMSKGARLEIVCKACVKPSQFKVQERRNGVCQYDGVTLLDNGVCPACGMPGR